MINFNNHLKRAIRWKVLRPFIYCRLRTGNNESVGPARRQWISHSVGMWATFLFLVITSSDSFRTIYEGMALILHFKDTTLSDSLQIMIQSCFIVKPYFMTLKPYFITFGCVNILQKLKSCIFVVWLIAQDQLLKIWHSIS